VRPDAYLDGTENLSPNQIRSMGRVNGSSDNKIVSLDEVYKESLTNNNKSDVPISTEILNMSRRFD
jgi:hypothetical protein